MRSAKKKWVVISLFAAVLFVTWGIYVLRFNKYYHDLDEVPAQDYSIGEFAAFDDNYSSGSYYDGYSIRVNDYEIVDTEEYVKRRGKECALLISPCVMMTMGSIWPRKIKRKKACGSVIYGFAVWIIMPDRIQSFLIWKILR